MAQIKKDTSLRKAILQAAITGQLISDIGGESDVLFSNEKKSKTKLDSEADLPLASRVSKRNSVVSDSERTTPSPRGYAPKTPNEFASFENQNSVSERSERPTLPETGKQLLDRIIEERNKKLLAEWEEKQTDLFASNDAHSKNAKTVRSEQIRLLKKAKKPAPIVASEIDEEEIPFEIPENWCWCRLGDICLVKGGKRIPAGCTLTDIDTGHKYIRVADMKNGSVIVNNVKYITDEIHEKIKAYKISKDDVYITVAGTIGDSGIIPDELDNANLTENADKLVLFNGINKYCLHFFLSSGFFQEQISDAITKVGQPKLAIIRIQNFLLPLPPLAVQNAIVETLEQVLPLVDVYENAIFQKEELKSALPDKVKKAILQEAITGKLTETWRKSATIKESGKQLLDRIIKERNAKALADWEESLKKNPKAKKPADIVASEIEEEEIPFEVPESWCWCRWGELSELIQYGYNAPAKESGRIKMVRITDIQNGKVQWNTVPFCEISDTDIQIYQLRKNDILFARTGGTVGKSFLVDEEPENAVFAGYLIRTQYDDKKLNPKYMKMFMESQIYWDQLKNGTIATAQPNCNGQTLSKMILPLPPLEEQQEIVKKVEELLELCK
ncbi:MAG: restriction endonuclease subunit S [Treponema sp.]|nr:restriction endonuclease subunit S [Treponema sp.]